MLFEGSEKKVEVAVSDSLGSLRERPREFWDSIVKASEAQVLSVISSSACDAYLLSESSLFVWDDYFTMITCGQTRLLNAIVEFSDQVGIENVDSLIFERKNEYFPRHQKSDFFEDYEQLKSSFGGKAFRFGHAGDHHLFLYHLDKAYKPRPDDNTVEILMYDLQGKAKEVFGKENLTAEQIREQTGVDKLLDGFQIDDFAFEPRGYSLNALKDDLYFTIHVTPEETGSYVSFESNIEWKGQLESLIQKVVATFEPSSFDVILFSPEKIEADYQDDRFVLNTKVMESLSCGYSVNFLNYYKKSTSLQGAVQL